MHPTYWVFRGLFRQAEQQSVSFKTSVNRTVCDGVDMVLGRRLCVHVCVCLHVFVFAQELCNMRPTG